MIQLPTMQPTATPADGQELPTAARSLGRHGSADSAKQPKPAGFTEQMAMAGAEADELPVVLLPADVLETSTEPDSAPVIVPAAVGLPLPAQLAEPGEAPQRAGEITEQELPAEQWLLAMLGQLQATIEARDGEASVTALAGPRTQPQPQTPRSEPMLETAPVATSESPLPVQQPLPGREVPQPLLASSEKQVFSELQAAKAMEMNRLSATLERPMPAAAPIQPPPQPLPDAVAEQPELVTAAQVERLLASVASVESGESRESAALSSERGQTPQLQAGERLIKLQAPETRWGEQMLHALRENVELQLQQRVQNATIRLDPPELGSLEIFLSHESGRLNVQISAAHVDVARLLQQSSDRLRQELVGQNFMQVNVQVSSDGQQGQQGQPQGRPRWASEETPLAASPQAQENKARTAKGDGNVLVTV